MLLLLSVCDKDLFSQQRTSESRGAGVSGSRHVMEAAGKGGKAAREREAKNERSTGHNPEDCPVCMTVFDDTVHRPCTLPCGHTVCTLCVNRLKQQGHVACPECRIRHTVPEGGQFPVSYTIEALLRRRDAEAAAAASPPPSAWTGKGAAAAAGQKEAAGLSRKTLSLLQEEEALVMAAIIACQEVQTQLDKYQTTVSCWSEQQQQLEDRLQGLLDQSRSVKGLVRQEKSRAEAKRKEAREVERQLHAALEALRTPATNKAARAAVVGGFRCTEEAEQVLEQWRGSFPDANTTTTVRKVIEASIAAMEAFQAALEAFQDDLAALKSNQVDQAALKAHPSVGEEEARAQNEAGCFIPMPSLREPLQAKDLRSPTQHVKRLLEAGRVVGVHGVNDKRRYARVSLEDDRVYLYTLREGYLSPDAKAIEVNQMVPAFLPCTVFMDLSWPGSASRRVHIRLSPDTRLGCQMLLRCTGQHGSSYAGTRLLKVVNKGQRGECVCVAGSTGVMMGMEWGAQLRGLDESKYRRSGKAGAVCGTYRGDLPGAAQFSINTRDCYRSDLPKDAQFAINTRDCYHGVEYGGVFGEVVQGMDVVVAAAQHTNIEEVTVNDCGVVLFE